jgi:hypothetical protein
LYVTKIFVTYKSLVSAGLAAAGSVAAAINVLAKMLLVRTKLVP